MIQPSTVVVGSVFMGVARPASGGGLDPSVGFGRGERDPCLISYPHLKTPKTPPKKKKLP